MKFVKERERMIEMAIKGSFLFVMISLLLVSACTAPGYSRSYIISDTAPEEILEEPMEDTL